MSDFNSSLPVRTENNGDVVAKIADATTPSQQLAVDSSGLIGVKEHDGAGTALTSTLVSSKQALDVNVVASVTGSDTSPATQNITAQDTGSTSTSMANGQAFITGSPTANSTASFSFATPVQTVKVQVTGTWTGTLVTEISEDGGTTWVGASLQQVGTDYLIFSATNNFIGDVNSAAATNFRVRATAAWTGTATVKVVESSNRSVEYLGAPVKLSDGSAQSTLATIKAASTPAASTDTSLVVAINPNTPLPAGTNTLGKVDQGAPNTIGNAWPVKPTDGTNSQSFTASGEAKVDVTQPLPAGTNNIGKVSIQDSSGNPFSESNPLPVEWSVDGTPVDDFKDASSIAANASDNHDYTVTALKTLYLTQVEATASGKAKMQIQIETGVGTGTFTTKWVQFNSTAETNMGIKPTSGITVAAGVRVRVVMTNLDKASQDLYSTISGHEE